MIKTIEYKKMMRLDELIKCSFDNDIRNVEFISNNGAIVQFDENGNFKINENHHVRSDSLFEFEVEEEITEDTVFGIMITVGIFGTVLTHQDKSLSDLYGFKKQARQVFALIKGKLELLWECDSDEV